MARVVLCCVVLLFVVAVVIIGVVVAVPVVMLVLASGSCGGFQTFLLSVNYGYDSTLSAPCAGRLVSVSRSS